MVENYFKQMMDNGYSLLVDEDIVWPEDFTTLNKIAILTQAMSFYTVKEDFNKCADLKKKIDKLQVISKPTKRSYVKKSNKESKTGN